MDVPTLLNNFGAYGFDPDDEVITETRKVEALNEAYWDACSREAWPFLETSATLTYNGTSAISITDPGDIGVVQAVVRSDGGILAPWRRDDFLENYGSQLTKGGNPGLYYFEGGILKLYPVPTSSNTVIVQYLKIAPALTAVGAEASILIPPRWHRSVLLKGALIELAILQDDLETAQVYKAEFEEAIARMANDLFPQQTQRPDFIHVSDPDNYEYN